eukprot:4154629-Prymnesium_polylepis.1
MMRVVRSRRSGSAAAADSARRSGSAAAADSGGHDRCHGMWSRCPGLEASLNSARAARTRRSWRVVLSISMFEPAWYVRETLENALAQTADTTLILLHLSADTNYSLSGLAQPHLAWLWAQERIEVSCFRHHVKQYSGT